MEREFRRVEDALSEIGYRVADIIRSGKSSVVSIEEGNKGVVVKPSPARKPVVVPEGGNGEEGGSDEGRKDKQGTGKVPRNKVSGPKIVYGGVDYDDYAHFIRALSHERRGQSR